MFRINYVFLNRVRGHLWVCWINYIECSSDKVLNNIPNIIIRIVDLFIELEENEMLGKKLIDFIIRCAVFISYALCNSCSDCGPICFLLVVSSELNLIWISDAIHLFQYHSIVIIN